MYFSKVTALALTSFLLSVSAAPLSFRRDTTTSASYSSLSKPIVSPYYLYFGNSQTSKLADAFTSVKMKSATIGFASAPKGSCSLTADLDGLLPDIQAFIGKGGAISLSFGGNLQDQTIPRQHIQQACGDVPTLTKLIEDSMAKFGTHNIEFDIEDDALLSDTAASTRLAKALVQVKKDISDTYITYTVGANTNGMPTPQNAYVQAAKNAGLTIDSLILMTMNMGGTDNVKDGENAVTGGAAQLASIYGIALPDAVKKMGMLPAIGVDNDKIVLDLAGMNTLGQFAKSQGLNTISMWNFNRDFPGGDPSQPQSLNTSSSSDEKNPSQFFTTLLSSVAGSAPAAGADAISAIKPPTPSAQQPGQKLSLPPATPDAAPGGGTDVSTSGDSTSDTSTSDAPTSNAPTLNAST